MQPRLLRGTGQVPEKPPTTQPTESKPKPKPKPKICHGRDPDKSEPREKQRTPSECCKAAADAGLAINDNGTPTGGTVICCDGRKITCVFYWSSAEAEDDRLDLIKENEGYHKAVRIQNGCLHKHENVHARDMTCPDTIPYLSRPRLASEDAVNKSECEAYKAEAECLRTNKVRCANSPDPGACESLIEKMIKDADEKANDFCNRKPTAPQKGK